MKKKAAAKGKARTARKRSALKDLSAKKTGKVKGGVLIGLQLPAIQQVAGDGSVRTLSKVGFIK